MPQNLLVDGLKLIRDIAVKTVPGTSVAFADGDAATLLADNEILGVVSVYGMHGKTDLTADDLKKLGGLVREGAIVLSASHGNLQVRGNRVTRFVVAEDLVKKIKELLADRKGPLEGVYGKGFLSDNVIDAGANQWVTKHAVLTSNSFGLLREKEDAGTVLADSAVYMGNHAPGDIRLFNVSRSNAKAANLTVNIVDV